MNCLTNKHIYVMGLGRFGGGAGVSRFAVESGAVSVTVSDLAPADQLQAGLEKILDLIDGKMVRLSLGGHDIRDLDGTDIVIANPAVPTPWKNTFLSAALERGITLETEIGLTTDRINKALDPAVGGRVIAITGSVGKSTTAAMTHHALVQLGIPAVLGGNIGGSLLAADASIQKNTVAVLELSSAMLHWLRETRPQWSPDVAVLTAFEPNHLDWHADLDHYKASKRHLLESLSIDSLLNTPPPRLRRTAVLAPRVADWTVPAAADRIEPKPERDLETVLPGAHNRQNAALAGAAIAACTATDVLLATHAAASFPGLPHRLAHAGVRRGVSCFNDSKSTTPGTTAAAMKAVRERHPRVLLIAGGADKGVDLSSLAALDARTVLTIGTTGPTIAQAVRDAGASAIECGDLNTAVERAAEIATPDDAILLSPACASWDQFPNYETRGEAFLSMLTDYLGPPE